MPSRTSAYCLSTSPRARSSRARGIRTTRSWSLVVLIAVTAGCGDAERAALAEPAPTTATWAVGGVYRTRHLAVTRQFTDAPPSTSSRLMNARADGFDLELRATEVAADGHLLACDFRAGPILAAGLMGTSSPPTTLDGIDAAGAWGKARWKDGSLAVDVDPTSPPADGEGGKILRNLLNSSLGKPLEATLQFVAWGNRPSESGTTSISDAPAGRVVHVMRSWFGDDPGQAAADRLMLPRTLHGDEDGLAFRATGETEHRFPVPEHAAPGSRWVDGGKGMLDLRLRVRRTPDGFETDGMSSLDVLGVHRAGRGTAYVWRLEYIEVTARSYTRPRDPTSTKR